MKIKGKRKYFRALIIDKKRIDDLEAFLQDYADTINYEAETHQGTTIEFTGKDELTGYDNYGKRRIKTLTISGRQDYSYVINLEFGEPYSFVPFFRYGVTFEGNYSLNSISEETQFQRQLNDWLKKATASYWIIGKFSLYKSLFYISLFIAMYSLYHHPRITPLNLSIGHFLLLCLIATIIVVLAYAFDNCIMASLFPAVSFRWGEESNRQDRIASLRNGVLWSVIIAFLIGVFAGVAGTYFSHFLGV